nr:hypothetical protein [bacterium]
YQGEVGIVANRTEMRAPVISFSDNQNWYNATDSLADFNLLMNPKIDNWKAVTKNVTEAYLKLAEQGLMSVSPQFYVNRKSGEVRLAALGSIFSMKSFPFGFFIESIVSAMTSKFNLLDERTEIERMVRAQVLAFLGDGRLHAGIELADLPGEEKEALESASNLSMDTVEVARETDARLTKEDERTAANQGDGPSKTKAAGKSQKPAPIEAGQSVANLPKPGSIGK